MLPVAIGKINIIVIPVAILLLAGGGYPALLFCIVLFGIIYGAAIQWYPRSFGIRGEFLVIKWLFYKKNYHLSSIEGLHLREIQRNTRPRGLLTDTRTEAMPSIYYAVVSIRGRIPLILPLWRGLPKLAGTPTLTLMSYLSKIAATNAEREASDYINSELKLLSPQNFFIRPLGGMIAGLLGISAPIVFLIFPDVLGQSSSSGGGWPLLIIIGVIGAVAFVIFAVLFILRFTKPGIGISRAGARKIGRLQSDRLPTDRVWVEFVVFNYRNIAYAPQLIVRFNDRQERSLVIPADYNTFFPAIRFMRKWPKDRFGHSISRYKVGVLDDDFRATVERIRHKRISAMKEKNMPISAVDADTLRLHVLMDPEELFEPADKNGEPDSKNAQRQ
jgi:hypothetical protein